MKSQGRGRTRRADARRPGERSTLSMRIASDLWLELDRAATASGRSLSQAAELRLEMSFQMEKLFDQLLELRYGRQFAGILLMLARAMDRAGRSATWNATQTFDRIENWPNHPYAFDQAAQAAEFIIEALRPPGDFTLPGRARSVGGQSSSADYEGADHAAGALLAVRDPEGLHEGIPEEARSYELKEFGTRVHQLLGKEITERIADPDLRAMRAKATERADNAR